MSDPDTTIPSDETPATPAPGDAVPQELTPEGVPIGDASDVEDDTAPAVDAAAADAPVTDAPVTDALDPDAVAEVDDPRSPEELRTALAAAETARDEYLDDLRRARAEFENFRRRTTREAAAARGAGRGDVAAALFEILDDLDRTVQASEGSPDETLAKGVALVADKLQRALEGQGLVRVAETGIPFDPEVHEAVQQVEADEPADQPLVATVLRPGYRLDDRILRPAMVVVAG